MLSNHLYLCHASVSFYLDVSNNHILMTVTKWRNTLTKWKSRFISLQTRQDIVLFQIVAFSKTKIRWFLIFWQIHSCILSYLNSETFPFIEIISAYVLCTYCHQKLIKQKKPALLYRNPFVKGCHSSTMMHASGFTKASPTSKILGHLYSEKSSAFFKLKTFWYVQISLVAIVFLIWSAAWTT